MSEHNQTRPETNTSAEAMKKLFVEYKKAQDKLQQLQQQRTEPLAIIGASCRFPGGANDLQQFWQVLADGINTITPVDPARWDAGHYYAAEQKAPGKMYTTHGGYLQLALDQFDHQFFAVSPKEAKALDPQQRLLLEVAWEAMEVAALDPQQLKGSATSVFIGMSSDDYAHAHLKSGDPATIDAYSMTGATHSTAAGRLSYTFGFEGPAVTVDTACSSSNVALHLACQSLRSGESDLALVGGVNLILTPIAHIAFTKLQAISPHGIVRTFDADASGYVRAEGCGLVVVKRLSDALRDGDPIMALVRGTAVNQDGRSNGFTAPSGLAQQKVIRQALANAGLQPLDVDYVEAHGTGTPLGDPIEVEALQTVYGAGRPATQPLKLGSVKTNLGHLEPAAAISGLIKLLLSLSHRQLPASLNFSTPNPHIQWQGAPVQVIDRLQDWQVGGDVDKGGVRRAGLSSFGFSGTNSHVIVEQAPDIDRQLHSSSAQLLILSGRQLSALQQQAERFADFLQLHSVELADLAYTSACGRSLFQERLALVVSDKASAISALRQIADGQLQGPDRARLCSHEHKPQSLALLFTGQGSQYVGMAQQLYQQLPVFRQALDEVLALFAAELPLPLQDVLWPEQPSELINDTAYAQPAIFAVQYALAQQWLADGVAPQYVAGHSIGEYAAAVVAGVFSLADAVRLVAARGRLMQQAPGQGGMTAVFAARPAVDSLLLGYRGQLSVAAVNATDVTVVSGALDAMAQFIADCQAQELETRPLVVSHGFHSPLMEPVLADFAAVAATVQYHEPTVTFVSALTGQPEKKALTRPDYWVAHVREAVLFLPVLQYLQQQQVQVLLEVGTTDTLTGLARRLLQSQFVPSAPALLASQKRDQPGLHTYLLALGQLQLRQPMVGVAAFYQQQQARRIAIPTYPFQRESHWMPLRYDFAQAELAQAGLAQSGSTVVSQLGVSTRHALLGERLETPALGGQIVYGREYTANTPFFMAEHIVYDTPISPAAAHVSLLLSAARDVLQQDVAILEQIDFLAPLIARDGERRAGQVILTPESQQSGQYQFELVSRDALQAGTEFTRHCSGRVQISQTESSRTDSGGHIQPAPLDLAALRQQFNTEVDVSAFNQFFEGLGFKLGDGFRRIQQVWKGHNEGLSRLTLKADVPDRDIYLVYPGLIDSLFHTSLPVSALDFNQLQQDRRAFIPISVGRVCLYASSIPAEVWAYTRDYDVRQGSDVMTSDITVCAADGTVLLTIEGITAKRSAESVLLRNLQVNTAPLLYQQEWQAVALAQPQIEAQHYLLLADRHGVSTRLAEQLQAQGHQISMIWSTVSESQVAQAAMPALHHLYLDLSQATELPALWQHCLTSGASATAPAQLVYAAALDVQPHSAEFQQDLITHYQTLLTLVQQTALTGQPLQLWLLLDSTAEAALAQSALLGLAQVIALEHADLWRATVITTGLTAAESGLTVSGISALSQLLQANAATTAHEPLWRLQHEQAAVARLERLRLPALAAYTPEPNRTYLVSGGLGALGRQVATSLLQRGARKLVLTGRKAADSEAQQWLQQLSVTGDNQAEVQYQTLDMADAAAVAALIGELPDLAGVFHCAGVLDDGLIADQNAGRFAAVFAGKALGAWHLHQATQHLELDCFVLFSSVTALFGSPGQSNYVAANQFLNALASLRRQQGLAATSVNWGPWLDGGMASDDAKRGDRLAARGIHSLSPVQAMAALWQLLSHTVAAPAVVEMDWVRHQDYAAPAQRLGLFSSLLPQQQTAAAGNNAAPAWLQLLQQAEPSQRLPLLLQQMTTITAKVLGYSPQQSLDPDLPLMDLGADSLMMVEARSQLASAYQVKLPASFFFNYPSLRKAADYLLQQALPELSPKTVTVDSSADVLADIAALLD